MSLNFNMIRDNFFSLFPGRTNIFIAEYLYGVGDAQKKQYQVSKWSKGKENITWDALEMVVDKEGLSWDWLLTGSGKKHKKTPPAEASGAGEGAPEGVTAQASEEDVLDAALQCLRVSYKLIHTPYFSIR